MENGEEVSHIIQKNLGSTAPLPLVNKRTSLTTVRASNVAMPINSNIPMMDNAVISSNSITPGVLLLACRKKSVEDFLPLAGKPANKQIL